MKDNPVKDDAAKHDAMQARAASPGPGTSSSTSEGGPLSLRFAGRAGLALPPLIAAVTALAVGCGPAWASSSPGEPATPPDAVILTLVATVSSPYGGHGRPADWTLRAVPGPTPAPGPPAQPPDPAAPPGLPGHSDQPGGPGGTGKPPVIPVTG